MKDQQALRNILHHMDLFERRAIAPSDFTWKYFEALAGKNRSTLWRDPEIRSRYRDVKAVLDTAMAASDSLTPLQAKRASDQQRIRTLETQVAGLRGQLDVAQERLVEMQVVLMDRGIDPAFVLEKRLQRHPHE